jgi:hypothetical protein
LLVPLLVAEVYARSRRPELAQPILERERRRDAVNPELPFTLLALGRTQRCRAAAQVHPRDCRDRRLFDGDAAFGGVFAGACESTN